MLKKIKIIATTFAISLLGAASLSLATVGAAPVSVPSNFADFKQSACDGLNQVDASQGCDKGQAKIDAIVKNIVNVISIVIGVVAVLAIIYAGFKYISSGGDSGKVSEAKTALIYALVGLFVAAIAQFLVNVVFRAASQT